MEKVWMVWKTVDFGQDWLEGVFDSKSKAENAMNEMQTEWMNDMKEVFGNKADEFDSPFVMDSVNVQ
jgi:hypothetical protein